MELMRNKIIYLLVGCLFSFAIQAENKVYIYNPFKAHIARGDTDGNNYEVFLQGRDAIAGIDVDPATSEIYWIESNNTRIMKSKDDGADETVILSSTSISNALDLELDTTAGKMYFAEFSSIRRANLDGTGLETIVSSITPRGIALTSTKVYWFDISDRTLRRANKDGTGAETLTTESTIINSTDVEVDEVGGHVFVMSSGGTLRRGNLDGTGMSDHITGLNNPQGFEIDLLNSRIYITETGNRKIHTANLSDGSALSEIAGSIDGPYDIAIIPDLLPASNRLFITDRNRDSVFSASHTTGTVTALNEIVDGSPADLKGLDFDYDTGDIYIAEENSGEIVRYNPDGTNGTVVLSGLVTPYDVEVDEDAGKLYYHSWNADSIHRANLDGSNHETIASSVNVGAISIDGINEKIYWTEYVSGNIKQANLDGTGVITLNTLPVVGFIQPRGLAYSRSQAKLFISESLEQKIYSMNVDGTNLNAILTLPSNVTMLKVDEGNQKIYWTENGGHVKRANYDGSNLETVFDNADGVHYPAALALLLDKDGDGVYDPRDLCQDDNNKSAPGVCGCNLPDTDTDGDGTADCIETCDADPEKTAPGVCGCGVSDDDGDTDGTLDCIDLCPADPDKIAPLDCGCGVADEDTNGNAILDCKKNPETEYLLTQLKTALTAVRQVKESDTAVKRSRKAAKRRAAKDAINAVVSYATTNISGISLSPTGDLNAIVSDLRSRVNKSVKAAKNPASTTFKKKKRIALRKVNALMERLP